MDIITILSGLFLDEIFFFMFALNQLKYTSIHSSELLPKISYIYYLSLLNNTFFLKSNLISTLFFDFGRVLLPCNIALS